MHIKHNTLETYIDRWVYCVSERLSHLSDMVKWVAYIYKFNKFGVLA